MPEEQNYYDEMGIPLEATTEQIKEAYKKLAKKYHPDLNPDMQQWAAVQMKKLNIMYDTLIDAHKRLLYNRKIGKHQAHPPYRPQGYARQRNETQYKSQSKQTATKKPYNISLWFSAKTLRNAAIGMLLTGLITFLTLSFLPINPPEDIQWPEGKKRASTKSFARVRTPEEKKHGAEPPLSVPYDQVNPATAETHFENGVDYLQKGMFPDAATEFEEAVRIDPEHYQAHAYLAFAYDVKGRLDEAIHEYEKAISINPDFADAYYGLYVIYNKKGMFERAERELEIYKWLTGEDTE